MHTYFLIDENQAITRTPDYSVFLGLSKGLIYKKITDFCPVNFFKNFNKNIKS